MSTGQPHYTDLDELTEVEVTWSDPYGRVQGKRVPAAAFGSATSSGRGFTFCEASLAWNFSGDIQLGASQGDPSGGYPDAVAVPDLSTLRRLPWRKGAGQVIADIQDPLGHPADSSPRQVLRRVLARLADLGYTAQVGVELEFYVLKPDGALLEPELLAYSLELANVYDPLLTEFTSGLTDYVPVEGVHTEYGPGQLEINLTHQDALTAADDAFRLRYAVKELARRHGLLATFMAKPFNGQSGSSSHLHLSLWREGDPAFAPVGGEENPLTRSAIAGVLEHLPALVAFGGPTVNSYKRYEPYSFAPTHANWGNDDRSVAVRSLVGTPRSTRLELRTPAADANPYWAVASALAAVVLGVEEGLEPPKPYGGGPALPATLAEAVQAARSDGRLADVLGADPVHDYLILAESEWTAYKGQVTSWEVDRYLRHA